MLWTKSNGISQILAIESLCFLTMSCFTPRLGTPLRIEAGLSALCLVIWPRDLSVVLPDSPPRALPRSPRLKADSQPLPIHAGRRHIRLHSALTIGVTGVPSAGVFLR